MKLVKHQLFGIGILAVLLGALPVEASRANLDVSVARPVLAAGTFTGLARAFGHSRGLTAFSQRL